MSDAAVATRPTSFAAAFAVLPREQRDAIRAVHAWSPAVDDGVDEADSVAQARDAIARKRREIAAIYGAGGVMAVDGASPDASALAPHVSRFGIPRAYLEALVQGVEMDLDRNRYATFQDLAAYCYRVASVVGLICLRIFGDAEERGREYAEDLGVALQLTNILRDVGSDLARGRIYLPEDERREFGVTDEVLASRERSRPFLDLMRYQAARARAFFAAAEREAQGLDRRRMIAAEIMGRTYRSLLDRIERSGFDVFRDEIRVPKLERAWIAVTAVLAARARP
jgi:phytoene synthase